MNKYTAYNNLQQFLFTEAWQKQVWNTFLEHLQLSID